MQCSVRLFSGPIAHPDTVLHKKSLPPPSLCCLCSCMVNGAGGKDVQEKGEFFSQISVIQFILCEEGKE